MFERIWNKIKVYIRWISMWIKKIIRFITHDVWYLNDEDFSRLKKGLVRDIKVITLMLRTFTDQKVKFQGTALAFKSMLAVVPGLAIGLYLTNGVGLREEFADIVIINFGENDITGMIINAANNIVETAETGFFGFISMVTFIWIVISLMITVRQVFNNVWKVDKESNTLKMIGVILGITILAPFVVLILFSGSVVYSNILDYMLPSKFFFSESLKNLLSWLLFCAMSILVLTVLFKYVPGTKVHNRYAFKSAIIAGVIFTVVQFLYLETQILVAKQSAVYGVLAALPLFMLWLNLGWSIILYGAELTYAFQYVDQHRLTKENLDEIK